jgi:hypothetical protein
VRDAQNAAHVTDLARAAELERLVDRCGDLKQQLVAFAESARFDRWREQELAKAADASDDSALSRGSDRWVSAMDDFIMTFRFPDGTGVVDRFLAAHGKDGKELRKSDRRILEGWRDPVDGIFELRAKHNDSLTLLNLLDELEYHVYSSMSFARLPADDGDFVLTRLVPLTADAWLVSGAMSPFPREHARVVAELALEWSGTRPLLAFRNPEKARLGWEMMREDRDEFVEFFGSDQVVIPAGEAESRVNEYYRQHQEKALARRSPDKPLPEVTAGIDRPYFALPASLRSLDTIGVIYDETDGMSLLPDFGMLEELFAHPELAAEQRYADALLGYLDSESVYPGPLRRLAAAHPGTVDDVYRTALRKPTFTWAKQGDLLLRKRKPWYFKHVPYPKVTPTSDYLVELLSSPAQATG